MTVAPNLTAGSAETYWRDKDLWRRLDLLEIKGCALPLMLEVEGGAPLLWGCYFTCTK
jgi:hypothetical protein